MRRFRDEITFVDLHTHLLGMGDATFWINVMSTRIPRLIQSEHLEILTDDGNVKRVPLERLGLSIGEPLPVHFHILAIRSEY